MIRTARKTGANRRTQNLGGIFGLWLATMVFAGIAGPALAEKADRDKPMHVEADRVTVDDAKQIAIFEGKVLVTQGTIILRGDRMEVRKDEQGFKNGTVWGNLVYFRQKREGYDEYIEGWAERMEYDGRADKVQMFNRAYMKKGDDEVRGNYISYDSSTEFYQVIGGGAKAAAAGGSDGRVRAVIQPKSKDKPVAQPPVPLKADSNITPPREEPRTPQR